MSDHELKVRIGILQAAATLFAAREYGHVYQAAQAASSMWDAVNEIAREKEAERVRKEEEEEKQDET